MGEHPTYENEIPGFDTCTRDHCTPEERAVVEAAVADRLAIADKAGDSPNILIDRAIAARNKLTKAVTALVATRTKTESDPPC